MNDKERIGRDAREYCHGSPHYLFEHRAYIAGAQAERNKAIDDCIDVMKKHPVGLDAIDEAIIERLESLKSQPGVV